MKNFKDIRKLAEGYPALGAPADVDFWNKSLILNPVTFSEPTKDNNVFKAANLEIYKGKRTADEVNVDNQLQGYIRPIMFGDYVDYLMKLTQNEDVSLSTEDWDLLTALTELADTDEDELNGIMEQELSENEIKEIEEQYGEVFEKKMPEVADKSPGDKGYKKWLKSFGQGFNVKEDAEEIEEISKTKINGYLTKTWDGIAKGMMKQAPKPKDRSKGVDLAIAKRDGGNHYGTRDPKVPATNEETEVDEKYLGFDKLAKKVGSPALAAYIGRKKYGAKKFDHAAETGHKLGGK